MVLRAYDADQTFEWEYSGVKCVLRPLTARELAECQCGQEQARFALEVCRRGLFSAEGVQNEDGTPRKVKHRKTASRRGIVPDSFFDGLPSEFWMEMAAEILDRTEIDEDEAGNS